jgi:hypothetical protein
LVHGYPNQLCTTHAARETAPRTSQNAPNRAILESETTAVSFESRREFAIAELLRKSTDLERIFKEEFARVEEQLKELGHELEPKFLEPIPASRVQPFRKPKAKSASEKFCPICTTDPQKPVLGHDGRKHKGQKRKGGARSRRLN